MKIERLLALSAPLPTLMAGCGGGSGTAVGPTPLPPAPAQPTAPAESALPTQPAPGAGSWTNVKLGGGYVPGLVSTDCGQTWQQVASLSSHKMSKAQIEAVSRSGVVGVEQVIFDTSSKGVGSATQTIDTTAAPHCAEVAGPADSTYKTTDGGATWTGIATPVTGVINGVRGVFRSDDRGGSGREVLFNDQAQKS
ncbi:hypothetical protein GJ700_32695 [Duganella sp. FT92W]|uniref:Uncharacterized protein n=1 Tax=Pseudoduganella rivuli TaxID=2666085 RepID=A0A7X2IUQ6_9BURK|nr:hypothetical protein [Pseudoduganella rivuli]MRV76480.1 hypothetical protein [Pseudoduganella rivuli]